MGFLDNLIQDATEMGKATSTLYGKVSREAQRQYHNYTKDVATKGTKQAVLNAFNKAVNSPTLRKALAGATAGGAVGSIVPGLGTLGGAIGGAMAGAVGPRNYINASLAPYNLSLDTIPKMGFPQVVSNIKQGAYSHPLLASMDFLSLGGGNLLKPLGKALTPIGEATGLVPTPREKVLFRDLTEALNTSRTNQGQVYKGVTFLKTKPLIDRPQLTRYITLGKKGNLKGEDLQLARTLRDSLKEAEGVAINNGWISAKEAKDNTIAQYVMGKNSKDNPSLFHQDVVEYLNGNPSSIISNKIVEDIKKANKLYDDGKISYLTQAIASSYDPTGNIIARNVAGGKDYFNTRRIIGRSQAEDIGRKLDESIEFQLDKVYKSQEAQKVTNDLVGKYGRVVREGDTLKPNEVVVNPNEVKKVVADSFINSNSEPLDQYLRQVGRHGEGIAIDRKNLKAIANAIQDTRKVPFSSFNRIMKGTLLAQPHWVATNRIGNWSNNLMEGVGLGDYNDAITFSNLIPEKLRTQTSFNHYISDSGQPLNSLQASKAGITQTLNAIANFNPRGNKPIKKLVTGILEGTNRTFAEPIFKAEAGLELMDRYANFIRQAKRYAEPRNLDWKEVVKRSHNDVELYNKLNNKVNKSLGDYLGRNYNISPETYQYLSLMVPFYRFLSQTGRTTANQLLKRGPAYQAIVQQPTKLGQQEVDKLLNALNLTPEDFVGGVPYNVSGEDLKGRPTKLRMMGVEPLPVHSVASDLANLLSGRIGEGNLSPLFSVLPELKEGTRWGRPINTPYKESLKALGLPYDIVNQVKLTPSEHWKYIANTLGGLVSTPYRLSTTYLPEMVAYAKQQPLKSRFDTDPYLEIPSSYPRSGFAELIGKWGGLTSRDQYLPYQRKLRARDIIRNRRKYSNKVR